MYPQEHDALAAAIGELLVARGSTLAVVETSAGGLISTRLLSVPGASRWFERGVVAYTEAAKTDISAAATAIIQRHGAVSAEFVADIAEQLRLRAGTDYALAESGIAGPQGPRRSGKPAGSVVIGIASVGGTQVQSHLLPGTRAEVMMRIAQQAIESLHKHLSTPDVGGAAAR